MRESRRQPTEIRHVDNTLRQRSRLILARNAQYLSPMRTGRNMNTVEIVLADDNIRRLNKKTRVPAAECRWFFSFPRRFVNNTS